ncbi:MAG TPA: transposase, partial [Acetobacteraceae bacterium]|nr:transposase [Acetobacteraceae bacterium]
RLPDNVSLLPLPPYSPELNPMENIWDYLRGNRLSSRIWDSYEAILVARKDAWNLLIADRERIDTISYRTWASVNL